MHGLPSTGVDQRGPDQQPRIDIVIVNWNSGDYLSRCLKSILKHGKNLVDSIIVVDNASTDGSLATIERIDQPVHIIRNSENCGFAAACNQGAALGRAKYLLFLNPDTELYKDTLSVAITAMERAENKAFGICGVQIINEKGEIERSCSRFPTPARYMADIIGLTRIGPFRRFGVRIREWDHEKTREVDQVMGAFFLIRRRLFELLGGFDEQFFVYYEEVDLSYRAARAGAKTLFLAETHVFHAGGGSTRKVKAARLFYSLRSRILYAFKHFHRAEAWGVLLLTLLVEPFTRFSYTIIRGELDGVKNTKQGYKMLWADLARIMKTIGTSND